MLQSGQITRTVLVFVALLLLTAGSLYAQKKQRYTKTGEIIIDTTDKVDVIDVLKSRFSFKTKKIKPRKGKKVYFSLLPVSIPGGGRAVITSTSAGFYLGNRRNTFLSNVSFSPYLNFKGRYAITFRSNIYTSHNLYNIQGDTRFSLYPEYIYSTGNSENKDQPLQITYKYIRFYQNLLRRVKPYFLAGVGYALDYHIGINAANDTISIGKFTGYPYGTTNGASSHSSGLTFNLLYDTRNNALNPLPGAYANLVYRVNPFFLGNVDNTWKSLYLDLRKYEALPGDKRKVLALWSFVWTALDNGAPYLNLPAIGNDPSQRSGRGIAQNRYRGKSLVYLESEYRSDITDNGLLGYVVFANVHTVSSPASSSLSALHPAAGAGLRLKFNKRSNTNIAFDVGISKANTSISLNLGEAF